MVCGQNVWMVPGRSFFSTVGGAHFDVASSMDGRFLVVVTFLIERDHHDARFPIIGMHRPGQRRRCR